VLWQTNLGSQVTGFPVSYSVRDRQYVAVSVGEAVNTAGYLLITPEIRPSNNNSLYVFALPEGGQNARVTSQPQSAPSATSPTLVSAQSPPAPPAAVSQCRKTAESTAAESTRTPERAFSAAQSTAGKKVFMEQCPLCHGANMNGSASAPPLADGGFRLAWQGRSLGSLFDCMKSTMPPGRSGTLSDTDYANLLAAILDANGVAAGDIALPADPQRLRQIVFGRAP
jgi:mono/diheme cytochrome c family protein